eukprot:3768301-Alexandrium_andersonii.AAC.1
MWSRTPTAKKQGSFSFARGLVSGGIRERDQDVLGGIGSTVRRTSSRVPGGGDEGALLGVRCGDGG